MNEEDETALRVVLVDWLDSAGQAHWISESRAKEMNLSHCTSVGFLMRDDAEQLVLAQSIDPPGIGEELMNVNHVLAIPKIAVTYVCEIYKVSRVSKR